MINGGKRKFFLHSLTSKQSIENDGGGGVTDNDDYWFRVLNLCNQNNPSHFGIEFPSRLFYDFKYLDSGTYSHVIKANGLEYNRTPIVFKIIKVVQKNTLNHFLSFSFNGFELYSDVFQEIVISKALSALHNITCDPHGYEYQTHCFPKIFATKIVHGSIPNYFIIRKYDETNPKAKPVERFEDLRGVPREHLVILMKFCGDSLWQLIKHRHRISPKGVIIGITPEQALSVCYQVTIALAVAESIYQFEHRDLHICNILVKRTKKKVITFVLRSIPYKVKSFGVKACIIDATFSRVCLGPDDQTIFYTDLSNRLKGTASNPNPIDGQELAYQQMYNKVIDKWKDWFPETNIYWCKYFYNEVLCSDSFAMDCSDQVKRDLKNLIATIDNYRTLVEFVQNLFYSNSSSKSSTSVT
ncbi:hypothetical protein NH340_JMT08779 [Sarcoptes scabiei]|nr:hypothetical protein NH340_JMT08779 [Sarcoptes scabiei]